MFHGEGMVDRCQKHWRAYLPNVMSCANPLPILPSTTLPHSSCVPCAPIPSPAPCILHPPCHMPFPIPFPMPRLMSQCILSHNQVPALSPRLPDQAVHLQPSPTFVLPVPTPCYCTCMPPHIPCLLVAITTPIRDHMYCLHASLEAPWLRALTYCHGPDPWL
jgi:hypothetical protein